MVLEKQTALSVALIFSVYHESVLASFAYWTFEGHSNLCLIWQVDIRPEWTVLEQIPLTSLSKLSFEVGEPEDMYAFKTNLNCAYMLRGCAWDRHDHTLIFCTWLSKGYTSCELRILVDSFRLHFNCHAH